MASNIVLKALGLNKQPNFLDGQSTPPGSMLVASDVIIKRENIVESRRGYPLYGTTFGTNSDIAKQLLVYKNRIINHFSNQLIYDTQVSDSSGNSVFNAFNGTYLEPQTGRRIRSIESNGNLYFTSASGIKKISAQSADDFTTSPGFITQSGGIKAVDLSSRLAFSYGNETGFLPQDSAVAYRVVWGTNDANNNEILGTPSQRSVIYNSLLSLLLLDFNRLLESLYNITTNAPHPSIITDASLFDSTLISSLRLGNTASATSLQSNLTALAQNLDSQIKYADQAAVAPLQISGAYISNGIATVSFSSGTPSNYFNSGNKVNLAGFTPGSGTLNGIQTIATTTTSTSTTGTTTVGVKQSVPITTAADSTNSLGGTYFTISSANNAKNYYVWFNVSGNGLDPAIAGKTGLRINLNTNDTANTVATKLAAGIIAVTSDFTTSISGGNIVTIACSDYGPATAAQAGTSTFTVGSTTSGVVGNVITAVTTTNLHIGMRITGAGIPVNSYITVVGLGQITISNNVTASAAGVILTFDAGITFNTSASGNVIIVSGTINSHAYESIAPPAVPSIPATNDQLVALQTYLQAIITQLQTEPSAGSPPVISSDSQSKFISNLNMTTTSNVTLKITIPQGVTTSHFFQIYRSDSALATGTQVLSTDIFPNDELKLVYEAYPVQSDITAGFIEVADITPPTFAGAYLYTNATTGEGILQANDVPPLALDINKFKNVVFYANTQTRYSTQLNLLGVTKLISEFNLGTTPNLVISDGITTHTYKFVTGQNEITQFQTVADVAASLAGKYITFNSANDYNKYYAYYIVSGVGSDPLLANKIAIPVYLDINDSADLVATKTANAISIYNQDFTTTTATTPARVNIYNVNYGSATDGTVGTSGFTYLNVQQGRGEDPSQKQVLLSTNVSPALAVDETARSLVHVINAQTDEIINAFYLSDAQSVPGQMQFEARNLGQSAFYVLANDSKVGSSFNPDISPSIVINNISMANPTVITTATPHGMLNQDKVVICASNSNPTVDGLYTITYISPTSFSIPVNLSSGVAGSAGQLKPAKTTLVSDNLKKKHRIYYSKLLQPEAVPALNFLDIGAQDKAILRIFPLRDSLFVYKEDGLFRISGEIAPFNQALFDLSCVLIAPDSLDSSNNLIYGWTTQGITATSESGVNIISRPIDTDILTLATSQYTNFPTVTWGKGYESDNSYKVFTVQSTTDTVAQIAYRYSTLTNTWTTFNISATCGITDPSDDKEYLGFGDINSLGRERKNFDRTDYADREYVHQIHNSDVLGSQLLIQETNNAAIGDVITQLQYMTVYGYNNLLLHLDGDTTLNHDYYSSLKMIPGDDSRIKLDALLDKVANDSVRLAQPGASSIASYTKYKTIVGSQSISTISASNPTIITTPAPHGLQTGRSITISGSNSSPTVNNIYQVTVLTNSTFSIPVSITGPGTSGSFIVNNSNFLDIETSYNGLINTLNNDAGVTYSTYLPISNGTLQEAVIIAIDSITKKITLNNALDWVVGPITQYKSIPSMIQYTPQDMSDPLNLKHFREATAMFEDKGFSNATLSFASDLFPAFTDIQFAGTTNGIFGFTPFGYGFFGGVSNAAPFRTYIPAQVQRCRHLNVKFSHQVAREKYSLQGITLTGENTNSSRGYR